MCVCAYVCMRASAHVCLCMCTNACKNSSNSVKRSRSDCAYKLAAIRFFFTLPNAVLYTGEVKSRAAFLILNARKCVIKHRVI